MFLLDTNVVSELRKIGTTRANINVEKWSRAIPGEQTYLSVITVFEFERGVLLAERRDHRQGKILRQWLNHHVLAKYSERIIPISAAIAQCCASLHVPDPMSDYDAIIAATAILHGLTIVTRNIGDFERTGARLLNPWDYCEYSSIDSGI